MPEYVKCQSRYIGLRVPDEMLAWIEKEAGRRGLSEFVRQALAEKLARDARKKAA